MQVSPSFQPVAVIGAGPMGLATAAPLTARGLPVRVYESGASVAANFESLRHVRLFSPWRYNIDRAAQALLEQSGWSAPADEQLPTAGEVWDRYLIPLSRLAALTGKIELNAPVIALSKAGYDKAKTAGRAQADFVLQIKTPSGVAKTGPAP